MKALGFVVSEKKIFENCILKTYFLIGDHLGIIPVKFGQIPMSGFRGEDV